MRITHLLPFLLVAVPVPALACGDRVVEFATYPFDFIHFGVVLAALVLLRWSGNPFAWEEPEPTVTVQMAILSVCLVGAVGMGFLCADEVDFELTMLTVTGSMSAACVAAVVGMTAFERLRRLFWLRKPLLVLAVLGSLIGAHYAYKGHFSETSRCVFEPADPSVASQVRF